MAASGEQTVLDIIAERLHPRTRRRRSIPPVEQPDSLESVQVAQALRIIREDFDDSFRRAGKDRLNRRVG